jgi:hypothetical protein
MSDSSDKLLNFASQVGIDAVDIETSCQKLEQAAPILDLELDSKCPECGHQQPAHFDVQSYVLKRILNERELLLTEVHYLAVNYNWSLTEIMEMPRTMRKTLTKMLDN